jgi:hypothetical protein
VLVPSVVGGRGLLTPPTHVTTLTGSLISSLLVTQNIGIVDCIGFLFITILTLISRFVLLIQSKLCA